MKIQLERNDIEKLLKAFCPGVKYADGKLLFRINGSSGEKNGASKLDAAVQPSEKTVELGDMELTMRSRVRYCNQDNPAQRISGDLSLNVIQDGSTELDLRIRDMDDDFHHS